MGWLASIVLGSWYARCAAAILVGFIALKAYGLTKKHEGAKEMAAKIERKTNEVAKKVNRAGAKSGDPTVRGVRDPFSQP